MALVSVLPARLLTRMYLPSVREVTASPWVRTVLLVPEPYSELYRWYLEMQIDLVNMELAKHNNSLMLFENAWREYAGMYHRTHLPKCDTNFKY